MRLHLFLAGLLLAASARAAVIEVEGVQDSLLGAPTINHCTLRKAVINANTNTAAYPQCVSGTPGVDTIVFLVPGTITFAIAGISEEAATGDLDVTEALVITGHADGTIIDGADLDRIFDVHSGASLELNDLTLRNGTGLGWGGGIYSDNASVTLNRVTITGCHGDEGDGGAIYSSASTLVVNSSTISGNTADHIAGGIILSGGTAAVTSSTITGNSSGFSNLPGGISQGGASFTLRNTIVAGNGGLDVPNLAGTFTSLGYNIVGSYGTNPPSISPAAGDQLNVADALVLLGPLASNGGPTQTHVLDPGSIALDKGHASGATTDQRGQTRPCDDGSLANASGGDGGDVGAFERQVACVVGNPPNAVDDGATVAEDSGANAISVLTNDSDADSDPLAITGVTQGANGGVTFTASSVSYTPNANFFGNDSFTYTISDGTNSDTATVTVTVSNVQDDPNAVDDNFAVSEDSGPNAFPVLTNDTDADGDTVAVTGATSPANGTVSFTATSVSYAPNVDYFGNDSFTYSVSDGQGGTDTATVLVAVNNVNDAPVAANDAYSMDQDTTLTVVLPGVLGNDSDVDGDSLTATLGTNVSHGTLALQTDGSFVYTPDASYAGTDSFTYTAHDASLGSAPATVTIDVADTEPPVITASLETSGLWAPNHRLEDVGLAYGATDNTGVVTTTVTVYSNEDDGPTLDAQGSLFLRAERLGTGTGRFYLIRITATDAYGNTSATCLTVVVPKSMSAAHIASIEAQAAAAQAACTGAGLFVVGE